MACGGTASQASASWLMVPAAGAGTMGVWRSVSSWTGPSLRLAVFGSSALPGRHPGRAEQEISFTGWLGLLRALYEVTAESGEGARPGP